MVDDWNDLYVRTSVGETPSNRTGGLGSPDIIPAGISPVSPSQYTTPESYGRYYNTNLIAGKPNYIYVRARNSSESDPAPGKAYLSMSNPAVVLWPGGEGWTRIKSNNGNYYSELDPYPTGPQAIAVTNDPFVYNDPQASGHRCLVTWLSTRRHPISDEPPRITTADELAKFLKANPNYAHHNIDIAANTTGSVTKVAPFSSGTKQAQWTFGVQANNCAGFTVSFSSGTRLPNGTYIELKATTVQQDNKVTLSVDNLDVPPNFNTNFNYTYDQNNITKENFSVTFVSYFTVLEGDPLYELAAPFTEFGFPEGRMPANVRGIELGSIGTMKGTVKK